MPKLPDAETLRRALKALEALFQDPSQMERVYRELDRIDEEAARQRQQLLEREGIPTDLLLRIRPPDPETDLTSPDISTTLHSTMPANSTPEARDVAVGRARSRALRRRHPFVVALYSRKDDHEPETLAAWAERHELPVATVASWTNNGSGARKIPVRYAKLIEKELGVPATLATWRNGFTD